MKTRQKDKTKDKAKDQIERQDKRQDKKKKDKTKIHAYFLGTKVFFLSQNPNHNPYPNPLFSFKTRDKVYYWHTGYPGQNCTKNKTNT
jgi:hypothetical protein